MLKSPNLTRERRPTKNELPVLTRMAKIASRPSNEDKPVINAAPTKAESNSWAQRSEGQASSSFSVRENGSNSCPINDNDSSASDNVEHRVGYEDMDSQQDDNSNTIGVSVLHERVQELEKALKNMREENIEKEELIDELREALGSQEELVSDLQARYRDGANELDRFKRELSSVRQHNQSVCAENEELIEDMHDVIQECDDLKQQVEQRDAKIMALHIAVDAMDETHNSLLEDIDRQRERDERSVISGLCPTSSRSSNNLAASAAADERCEMLRCSLTGRIRHMNIEKLSLEQQLTDVKSKLSIAEEQIEALANERRRYKLQNERLVRKLKTVFSRIEIQEELDRATASLTPIAHPSKQKEDSAETSGMRSTTEATFKRMRRRASMATSSIVEGMKDATSGGIHINGRRSATRDNVLQTSLHGCAPRRSNRSLCDESNGETKNLTSRKRASGRRGSIWGGAGGGGGDGKKGVPRGSFQSNSSTNTKQHVTTDDVSSCSSASATIDLHTRRISKNSNGVRLGGLGGGYLFSSTDDSPRSVASDDVNDDNEEPTVKINCESTILTEAPSKLFESKDSNKKLMEVKDETSPESLPPLRVTSRDVSGRSTTFSEQLDSKGPNDGNESVSNAPSPFFGEGSLYSLNTIDSSTLFASASVDHEDSVLNEASHVTDQESEPRLSEKKLHRQCSSQSRETRVKCTNAPLILEDVEEEAPVDADPNVATILPNEGFQTKRRSRVLSQTRKMIQGPLNSARKHVLCQRASENEAISSEIATFPNPDQHLSSSYKRNIRPWSAVNTFFPLPGNVIDGKKCKNKIMNNEDETTTTELGSSDSTVGNGAKFRRDINEEVEVDDQDDHDSVEPQVIIPRADVDLYESFGNVWRAKRTGSSNPCVIKCLDTGSEQVIKPSCNGSELYEGFTAKPKRIAQRYK